MKGYFVTGTDTDAGKTFVAAALLVKAAAAGLSTSALKPVAAGVVNTPAGPRNGDTLVLQAACSQSLECGQITPICLQAAIAPHIAAREEQVELSVASVMARCRPLLDNPGDFLLVEGAGGWRVPLNDHETFADLARTLGFAVILVVSMKLGCINHALLSAEAIRRDGLPLAGWVANQVVAGMPRYRENCDTLRHWLGAPLLGEVPFLPSRDFRAAAHWLSLPGSD